MKLLIVIINYFIKFEVSFGPRCNPKVCRRKKKKHLILATVLQPFLVTGILQLALVVANVVVNNNNKTFYKFATT